MFSIIYFTNYRFYPVTHIQYCYRGYPFWWECVTCNPLQNMPALFRNLDTILTAGLTLRNVRLINLDVSTVPCLHLMLLYFESTEDHSRAKTTLAAMQRQYVNVVCNIANVNVRTISVYPPRTGGYGIPTR